jgi:hypothetical protein
MEQGYDPDWLVDDDYDPDYGEFEADEPTDYFGSMSINATQQKKPAGNFRKRPALPKAVWEALSRSDQMTWDNISDQAKFKIIFAYKDHIVKSDKPATERRKVQTHDVSPLEPSASEVPDDFEDAQQEPPDEPESTLLIQAAAQKSNVAPSDIRRVLSSTKGSKKSAKPNLRIDTAVHELT